MLIISCDLFDFIIVTARIIIAMPLLLFIYEHCSILKERKYDIKKCLNLKYRKGKRRISGLREQELQ